MINFLETDREFNPIYLDDKVLVYRDVLPDPENLSRIMKRSEADGDGKYFLKKWEKWGEFGTYTQGKFSPQEQEGSEFGKRFDEEKFFAEMVNETYNIVVGDYVKRMNIDLPDTARFSGCSFCKYDRNINFMKNDLTMQYHTDFIMSQKDMPGEKFYITCTMYINDDYEGGDIDFWVDGKTFSLKPKAGDIVVFPSQEPYYHGVKVIKNGEKFFVRNFVMYNYDGSPEWLANLEKYGPDKWSEMEKERIQYENPRNMLYINKETNERMEYEEVLKG